MSLNTRISPAAPARPGTEAEWAAQPLCPVAHWVVTDGRLACVWEVPDPVVPL